MNAFVLALEAVCPEDGVRIGGKAAALAALATAGFPVPPAICLTTAAFRQWIAPYQEAITQILAKPHLTDPARAQEAADAIAVLLTDHDVPHDVVEAVRAGLSRFDANALLAVRSSSTAEDRADVSFAGQYETVLGVQGERAVLDAILTCWRSFFSVHAIVARASAQALADREAMALLIQNLVIAECAGVAFSIDPVQAMSGHLVVNAAWGLGVGVVDSQTATDTYHVRRTDLQTKERLVQVKPERIVLSRAGKLQREPVPGDQQRAACLPERWLKRIAQFTIAAESAFGSPQDVEWAIADDTVWILQSRPVTGLPADVAPGMSFPISAEERTGPLWEIDGRSRHRVPLPLDRDIEAIRNGATQDAFLLSGSTWGGRLEITARKVVNGRVYTRSVPVDLHPGDARIRKNASIDLAHRLRESDVTPWEYYAPEIRQATERLSQFDLETKNSSALADHFEDALGAYRRHWALHFAFPDTRAFGEPFYIAFARLTGCSKDEAREASFPLLEGAGNMLTRLIDTLYHLAGLARGTSAEVILTDGAPGSWERLQEAADAGTFCRALESFLAIYGDRSGLGVGAQPAVHVPTWRENPALVFPLIAPYLNVGITAPEMLRQRSNVERERQAEALSQSADSEAAAVFLRYLSLMRRARTDLENHNHYIDQMAVGQLRAAILAAGRYLAEQGLLAEREDVFYLHREEITQALRADSPIPFRQTVAERKAQWATWEQMTPRPILGIPDNRLEPRPMFKDEVTPELPEANGGVLRGIGASAGQVRGRARVVPAGMQMPQITAGDILVAESAGPAWTPFFPMLGGLILHHTALFSHAATTAREYGIPAVIRIADATRRIPDGAWVTLNGTTGEVTIESESP